MPNSLCIGVLQDDEHGLSELADQNETIIELIEHAMQTMLRQTNLVGAITALWLSSLSIVIQSTTTTTTTVAAFSSFRSGQCCYRPNNSLYMSNDNHQRCRQRRNGSSSSNDNKNGSVSRRSVLSSVVVSGTSFALLPPMISVASAAAETIGKDENCNDSFCVGVWDGLLADCPHNNKFMIQGGAGCVCSQDDTPGVFSEP